MKRQAILTEKTKINQNNCDEKLEVNLLSPYLKKTFGTKVYKLSLSASSSCPNRDGTCGTGGCIFCSAGGSGDFAESGVDIDLQIDRAKALVNSKFSKTTSDSQKKYIAYFQSYTETYGDQKKLMAAFKKAHDRSEICAISIATRPDCIEEEMLDFLCRLNETKPVWIELGLQSIHEKTAAFINRGYSLEVFENTYKRLKDRGLTVIVHVILGLPCESREETKETVAYLAKLNPVLDGIKLQMLHVLEGTRLGQMYKENPFPLFELEEYCQFVVECLKLLDKRTVVHRITGDGPKSILIGPKWSGNKRLVLNTFKRFIKI